VLPRYNSDNVAWKRVFRNKQAYCDVSENRRRDGTNGTKLLENFGKTIRWNLCLADRLGDEEKEIYYDPHLNQRSSSCPRCTFDVYIASINYTRRKSSAQLRVPREGTCRRSVSLNDARFFFFGLSTFIPPANPRPQDPDAVIRRFATERERKPA